MPCSVDLGRDGRALVTSLGPPLATEVPSTEGFLSYLASWGGTWMWEHLQNEGPSIDWVLEAISNGTGTLVADGSFNRDLAPRISGAGWVFHCSATDLRLLGSFFEESRFAGSYRAERLGLLAGHTLLAALSTYYQLDRGPPVKICCDNKGALFRTQAYRRRIPAGSPQADVDRALRNVKDRLTTTTSYEWVESHLDDVLLWEELTNEQQLNCVCDSLAKSAVSRGLVAEPRPASTQLLPCEKGAIIVDGTKLISDASSSIRFALGRLDAERFYTKELGWSSRTFNLVDWETLDATLAGKSQMYKLWLAKQSSGCCGTQAMVSRWDPSRTNRCPDCGHEEHSEHLLRCPDHNRTRLLREQTRELQSWMHAAGGHRDLCYWIPKFILLRNTRRLASLPHLPRSMRSIARDIDEIGWINFVEGKVPSSLFALQRTCTPSARRHLSAASWAKGFLSRLLHLAHSQWIYRNVSLHDKSSGYLKRLRSRDMLRELGRLLETNPDEVPEDCRFLLEVDHASLEGASLDRQAYWILAVEAARGAGRVAVSPVAGQRRPSRRSRTPSRRGQRDRLFCSPTVRRSLGADDVEQDILRDFGDRRLSTARTHQGPGDDISCGSNKRRKPD